eukprot:3489377-Pleurochrysis_carterae.AAC.1
MSCTIRPALSRGEHSRPFCLILVLPVPLLGCCSAPPCSAAVLRLLDAFSASSLACVVARLLG